MARVPFNPDLVKPPEEPVNPRTRGLLSVAQLTELVKRALESALPATVHVVGELSNLKRHSSGHWYFTLKDRAAELSCVMWRSAAGKVKFDPSDGLEVIATGRVEVFERQGRYQLYVRKLEPRGIGALELAFRQLRDRLETEGLFDPKHKQPLPAFPRRIALVTSPTGAAVIDMLRTFQRRYPCLTVLLAPVRVQGEGAAAEIAAAIQLVNAQREALGGVDVIIAGRGGGSLEDLWAFNEEIVVRAIFASRIPVISAVGHEVDVTLADLVADVRAATPTAAAELAVPLREELLDDLEDQGLRLARGVRQRAVLARARFVGLLQRRAFSDAHALVRHRSQALDEVTNRSVRAVATRVYAERARLAAGAATMQRGAPHAVLRLKSDRLHKLSRRLDRLTEQRLARTLERLTTQREHLQQHHPAHALPLGRLRAEALARRTRLAIRQRLGLSAELVHAQKDKLEALSYHSVLGRGFSITRFKKRQDLIRSVTQLRDGARIVTELADGAVESEVVNLTQLELFE